MSASRYLKSRWVMGTALLRRLAMPFGERGPRAWLGRLAQEDLASVPEGMWEYAERTSRCIGCGLCDVVGRGDEAPSQWILGEAREPSTAPLGRAHAARLTELAESIAKICPARVPAAEVARLIVDNAKKLETLRDQSEKPAGA